MYGLFLWSVKSAWLSICHNGANFVNNISQKEGTYKGKKFNATCHFFGYQARGSFPSKFNCDYAFVCDHMTDSLLFSLFCFSAEPLPDGEISVQILGHKCYRILAAGLNGYMATVTNVKSPVNKWKCGAAPFTVGTINVDLSYFSGFFSVFLVGIG